MYTIINKSTGYEIRTHDMFRCSNIFPNLELGENEQIVLIPVLLIGLINNAYECSISVGQEGIVTAINVTKTMAEWQAEQPIVTQPKSELELLQEQLATQNQTQSDFMDYIFASFPEIA